MAGEEIMKGRKYPSLGGPPRRSKEKRGWNTLGEHHTSKTFKLLIGQVCKEERNTNSFTGYSGLNEPKSTGKGKPLSLASGYPGT